VNLYDQAIGETDTAKRTDLLRRAATALREDIPVLFLVTRASFLASTEKIRGVQYATRVVLNYDSAYRVE
jgi:ABC-type transport system substrate-binding protein